MAKTSNLKRLADARAGDLLKGPNLLSLSRILVAGLIIWSYEAHNHQISWLVIALVVFGVLSDYLDGYWARRRGEVSELGNALDPIADKIGSGLLFVYAVWLGRIPVAYLLFLIARDLIIMAISVYIRRLGGRMPQAIASGKISINAVAAYWMTTFFVPEVEWIVDLFLWLSLVLMIYSFSDYMVRFFNKLQRLKRKPR